MRVSYKVDQYNTQTKKHVFLKKVVCNIFSACTFRYAGNREGVIQSFFIVDELTKSLGAAIYRYKITSWDVLVENLNVVQNRTYRSSKHTFKPTFSKNVYPGQGVFEIHLTPYSSIVELTPETN